MSTIGYLMGLEGVAGLHGFERELDISRLTAPPILSSRVSNLFETYNLGYFLVETLTLGQVGFSGWLSV
jgi:hypothetical protein